MTGIYEAEPGRYIVQRYMDAVDQWESWRSFHDAVEAIRAADADALAWPEDRYRVIDTEGDK